MTAEETLLVELNTLRIKYKQVLNDLEVTRLENQENAAKYMELLSESAQKHRELISLKDNIEDQLNTATAELNICREKLKYEREQREKLETEFQSLKKTVK